MPEENRVLVQTNRASEENYETAGNQSQRASTFLIGAVRRNREVQSTAWSDAIESMSESAEKLVAKIETLRQMNTGEELVARFGDPTPDQYR